MTNTYRFPNGSPCFSTQREVEAFKKNNNLQEVNIEENDCFTIYNFIPVEISGRVRKFMCHLKKPLIKTILK